MTGMYETAEEFSTAVNYEWDKLMGYQVVSDPFWREAEAPKITAEIMHSWLNNDLVVRVEWPVAQRQLAYCRYPATWWDAVKERWFPAWAKRRWPIAYGSLDLRELYACKRDDERFRYSIVKRMVA